MPKIETLGKASHKKASEEYVIVRITFSDGALWEGWVPTVYRRLGLDLTEDEEIQDYLKRVAPWLHPAKRDSWEKEQDRYWAGLKADVTGPIFEVLKEGKWVCVGCGFPANTNPARRYQKIKEDGYSIASDTSRPCPTCGKKRLHLLLLPIPRGGATGYETWSPELRKRIIKVLGGFDAYEGKKTNPQGLLPDHKFPEIRWDVETRRDDISKLTDKEIRRDFQLLSNQRNQQKREVCRSCFQTGKRPFPFGVEFYYKGDENWPRKIPKTGKAAEQGCVGCGWYDLQKWREAQNSLNTDPEIKEVRERRRRYDSVDSRKDL